MAQAIPMNRLGGRGKLLLLGTTPAVHDVTAIF